jgi:mRNA-degrading endonuclease RelE of RelBE toxin-antitoxin system
MSGRRKWNLSVSNRFKRGYRNSSPELQRRIDAALRELADSNDPYSLGVTKQGPWRGYSAYDFGRSCRMIYMVDREAETINAERVCSHKEYNP